MEGDGKYDEARARRLFDDECCRRVTHLLEELHYWQRHHRRSPPAWMWERVALLADNVIAGDISAARLEETITAAETELDEALSSLALLLSNEPIPYAVTPLRPPPRLRVVGVPGGRA